MDLIAPSPTPVRSFAGVLRQREAALREQLQAVRATLAAAPAEVIDFKDVAAEDVRAWVDDAAHAHATKELEEVLAALRRISLGSYGRCEDCGEPIDERRLRALPATRFCTACQAIHERPMLRR